MLKHRGFPSRLPGTDYQFTIRRDAPKVTPIKARERYRDRRPADVKADEGFVAALWAHFGDQPFERGNLDAGRLNWVIGREVVFVEAAADPASYETLLRVDPDVARVSFPRAFDGSLIE
jgi:hypothetical protein